MRLGALIVSVLVLCGLAVDPVAAVGTAQASTSAATTSAAAGVPPPGLVAAKARPKARVAGSYLPLTTGQVRVVLTSNAAKVRVSYRTARNKKRTVTVKVVAGSAVTTLPVGSKKITAKTKPTRKLRASSTITLPRLKPPTGLSAAAGVRTVSLKWSPAPGVTR